MCVLAINSALSTITPEFCIGESIAHVKLALLFPLGDPRIVDVALYVISRESRVLVVGLTSTYGHSSQALNQNTST